MAYDEPNFIIRRESSQESAAGNAAVSCKFAHFQKLKVKAIHAIVTTAGTSAGHTIAVAAGGTALGTFTLGTQTASSTVSLQNINALVNPLTVIQATNGTDATGKAMVVYEFEAAPDGARSP